MTSAPQQKRHDCRKPGCGEKADRIPILLVYAHPLSRVQNYGVRSVLWLPLCAKHFTAMTMREFMTFEAMRGIEQSVNLDFDSHGAIADWRNAKIDFIFWRNPEFATWEAQYHRAMN